MKRTVTLILAMLFSLCLLLPAAASQDPSAEAASTRVYTVNGHWYTEAQYQSLFGGADGQARQAVDADAAWLLAGTDLITLSDSRNDPMYDSDLDHLKVDYAVIDGSLLSGGTLAYALIDADGNVTEDPETAVYIQFVEYGQTEYWVFGHVVYKDFVNGFANIEIDVADGSEWRVADASTISKLVIEPGAAVYGELTENEDGTITITASENTIPSGEYGFYELEEAVSSGSGEASGGASGEAS